MPKGKGWPDPVLGKVLHAPDAGLRFGANWQALGTGWQCPLRRLLGDGGTAPAHVHSKPGTPDSIHGKSCDPL